LSHQVRGGCEIFAFMTIQHEILKILVKSL
jgi:hypothetical protein